MTESNGPGLRDSAPLLEVRGLVVHHGQLKALSGISLAVYPGEVYAIIGANGAGKSTLLRTIAGLHHPTEGTISYEGRDITGARPEKRPPRVTPDRLAAASTFIVVAAATIFVVWQLHPMTLLFTNTMDAEPSTSCAYPGCDDERTGKPSMPSSSDCGL